MERDDHRQHQTPKQENTTGIANDRLKRDEWSEGAVSSLLEAYEAKWVLRNRAKLKGQDWDDVAKHVSARMNRTKSAKTQTQCKNKIESMKKRYRTESAAAEASSSWPLYSRLDLLLRGKGSPASVAASALPSSAATPPPVVVVEPPSLAATPPMVAPPGSVAQNSDRDDRLAKVDPCTDNNIGTKSTSSPSQKNLINDTDSSTENSNLSYNLKTNNKERKNKTSTKRRRDEYSDIGESLRWMAKMVVRSEQARMETMKEIERMRAEVEARKGEMDLKRTEIIANTQLQIAKIIAKGLSSVDSSLRIGRS